MTCSGIGVFSGRPIEITFDTSITSVGSGAENANRYVAPAWIDLQVNGFAGVDYNNPATSHEQIGRSMERIFATGAARFFPTVITGSPDSMLAALRNLARARKALENGEAMERFHVEGPHISPDDGPRGVHPRQWVRPPDLDEFQRWREATDDRIGIVTLSPEWPEAPRYIERIVELGTVASIGHTKASAQQIADAVSAGATLSTHLGNGAHSVLPRYNYIWEQLAEDRLMADFIVDHVHLPATFLKIALRTKGTERSVLVTDAVAPAGCAPGPYQLGEVSVELTAEERVVIAGGERLAGSALRMDRGVENLMRRGGLSLSDAVRMATLNPAKAGNITGRQRGLAPGDRADLVTFRYDSRESRIEIESTWLAGREVYRKSASAPR